MPVKSINNNSGGSDFVSIDLNADESSSRDQMLFELLPLLGEVKQIDMENAVDWNSFGPKAQEKFGIILREMTSYDWDRLASLLGSDSARFTEYMEYLKVLGQHLLHETSALKIGSTTLNQVRVDLLPRILACKEYLLYFAKKFERLPRKAKRHFCCKMLATFLFSVPVIAGSVFLFGIPALAGFLKPAVDFFLMIYAFVKGDGAIPDFCKEMVNVLKYSLFSLISNCDASLTKFPSLQELDDLGEIGRKLTFFAAMIPKLTVHRSWTDWYNGHTPTLADIPVSPKTEFIKNREQEIEGNVDHKLQNGQWVRI
jgi:hypothetical protein